MRDSIWNRKSHERLPIYLPRGLLAFDQVKVEWLCTMTWPNIWLPGVRLVGLKLDNFLDMIINDNVNNILKNIKFQGIIFYIII